MTTSFMYRSICWLHRRNGSTRTVRPGVPCSPLPGNRIGFSEQSGGSSSLEAADPAVGREFFNVEEIQAIVGVRIAIRGTGDQHGDPTGQLMLMQPGPGKIAPAFRLFDQLDRLDAA